MNNVNESMNQSDGFERARKLREEADALEAKARVRQRLLKLIDISRDPYYDQYLNQMLRDLEAGKATPAQVSREADRTYRLYQQRMNQGKVQNEMRTHVVPQDEKETDFGKCSNRINEQHAAFREEKPEQVAGKDTIEFKIGAGIFSIVGAVFVLAAFVIFGFNFLEGFWQGACLYAASLIVVLLSELLLKRLNSRFSLVITGIGISCLYISTIINYLVLKNMNGLAASAVVLAIALGAILLSRKKDAASIRIISFFGCYICFLPIRQFETELSFLVMTGILLIINIVSIYLPNQKNEGVISTVHLIAHTIFTGITTGLALAGGMGAMYVAFFDIASLVIINMIYYRQKEKNEFYLKLIFAMALGFMAVFLVSVGSFGHGIDDERILLFYKLLTEVMAVVTSVVFFILWGREERRWIQYYFMAALIVLFNGFSDYRLETTIGFIAAFVLTRLLFKVKEIEILDCIFAVLMVLQGFYMCKTWYVIPFAVVLFASAFLIKRTFIFHEIVLTIGFVGGICFQFDGNWTLPACVGTIFLLFLLFNHLPGLKDQKQLPYNITNVIFAGLFCLCTVFCGEYYFNAVTMVIGAVMIIVVFRARYGLAIPKKYLLLAGFLIYMILTSHFKTPVIVSILLMIVAIGSVGIGFKLRDKEYRICGLVMAVFVCIKLILYDFRGLESIFKVILFFTVGVIALAISFLYIYLEKKEDKKEKEENIEENIGGTFAGERNMPDAGEIQEKAEEPVKEEAQEKADEPVKEEAQENAEEPVKEETQEKAEEPVKEEAQEKAEEPVKNERQKDTGEAIKAETTEMPEGETENIADDTIEKNGGSVENEEADTL